MTHHSVMTSSLLIKILIIDKFGDFSCDINYNSRTDVFRDVISLKINQCGPRRPKGASGGYKVSASRAAQASEARLYYICNELIEETAGQNGYVQWRTVGGAVRPGRHFKGAANCIYNFKLNSPNACRNPVLN